jgi:hypothetical protein
VVSQPGQATVIGVPGTVVQVPEALWWMFAADQPFVAVE